MRYKLPLSVAAAAAIAAGVGIGIQSKRLNSGALSEPVRRGTVVESVYGIGTVAANRSFQLRSGVTSAIQRLHVKEGDRVERGAPLVDL